MNREDLQALARRWSEEIRLLDQAGLSLLALRLDQLVADANVHLSHAGLDPVRTPEVIAA